MRNDCPRCCYMMKLDCVCSKRSPTWRNTTSLTPRLRYDAHLFFLNFFFPHDVIVLSARSTDEKGKISGHLRTQFTRAVGRKARLHIDFFRCSPVMRTTLQRGSNQDPLSSNWAAGTVCSPRDYPGHFLTMLVEICAKSTFCCKHSTELQRT